MTRASARPGERPLDDPALWQHLKLARRLGAAHLARAEREFSLERILDAHDALDGELLRGPT